MMTLCMSDIAWTPHALRILPTQRIFALHLVAVAAIDMDTEIENGSCGQHEDEVPGKDYMLQNIRTREILCRVRVREHEEYMLKSLQKDIVASKIRIQS